MIRTRWALLVVAVFADVGRADMSTPFHEMLSAQTTVVLEVPMPEYVFFSASQFEEGLLDRLSLLAGQAVPVINRNRRMVIYAVPKDIADRFETDAAFRVEARKTNDVRTFPFDSFFEAFHLDTHRDDRQEIRIRRGADGLECAVFHRPGSSGSRWIVRGVSLSLVLAVAGFVAAHRRKRRRSEPEA